MRNRCHQDADHGGTSLELKDLDKISSGGDGNVAQAKGHRGPERSSGEFAMSAGQAPGADSRRRALIYSYEPEGQKGVAPGERWWAYRCPRALKRYYWPPDSFQEGSQGLQLWLMD
ncbi:GL19171 [Drosophila persimilis]|uniref:GL19171 n=1 Tax=Drosophila persimilis TaxID=7234 RepID=B4G7J3_DROPE|nr:GL19171 [Drosophila persimilis]